MKPALTRDPRTWVLVVAAITLALSVAPPARAGDGFRADVERVWLSGDSVCVDVELTGLLSDRIRDGLTRGLPMTYSLEFQVWRDRSGWWDSLESQIVREFRIQRDVWNDLYLVVDASGRRSWATDLDALEMVLSDRTQEVVTARKDLDPGAHYYVVVIPTLQPLTIEDIQEVEAWLTGEFETNRKKKGVNVVASLPKMVFGVFVDITGLGDKSTIARSTPFMLEPDMAQASPDSAYRRPDVY